MHRSAWNATEQRQAIANAGLAVLRAIAHEESRSLDSPRCGVEVGASDVAIDDVSLEVGHAGVNASTWALAAWSTNDRNELGQAADGSITLNSE